MSVLITGIFPNVDSKPSVLAQQYLETGLLCPFQGYTEHKEHVKGEHRLNEEADHTRLHTEDDWSAN